MGEEFQGAVCGGANWWNNSPRNLFMAASSPCSSEVWPPMNHNPIFMDSKTASDDSTSDGSSSIVLHEAAQYPTSNGGGNMSIASALQIMGISLSSTNQDSNPDLQNDSGRSEENYSHMLLASTGLNSSTNYERKIADFSPQIDKNWSSTTSFCQEYSSLRQVNQSFLPIEQQQQPISNMFSTSLPLNLASYSYASSLLQNLFDIDSEPQQSLLHNQPSNYPAQVNLPSLTKNSHNYKQQPANDQLQFVNNTPFWNAMSSAASGGVNPASFVPSTQPQFLPSSVTSSAKRPNPHNSSEESRKSDLVAKKASNEPVTKRPRIQTPSPLPTFKVRKEKMGDRITALQQLVSPFGKTDTASVLHEAIEYIKFLHDQVLSAPYLKNGSPPVQRQQAVDRIKDEERLTQDLKSRGLCLVPMSSTFPVAAETSTDFWTPTFGGSFR